MARVGLISCVSKKQSLAAPAKDLYLSPLFTKAREYVENRCDTWFILSAKHGLVAPNDVISPYDETLNTKTAGEREEWSRGVWHSLSSRIKPGDEVTMLAGERYRERLAPLISAHGCHVSVPMEGLGIGRQLQWLTQQLQPQRDLLRLYAAMRQLEIGIGGKRLLAECTAARNWPNSGVYFFFEEGQLRGDGSDHRIVRVGTHGVSRGSKATLWNRLRTHRGTNDGLGSHRSSIFRMHVGAAIAARDPSVSLSSWGVGQTASSIIREGEHFLERKVSEYIGSMKVAWLAVQDDPSPSSDRAYIERNLIGLLSTVGRVADPPTADWLGMFSPDNRIRASGLWNLDFLDYTYSHAFLDVFEEYVLITTGKKKPLMVPIAPSDWYVNDRQRVAKNQLTLFAD